jgi:uncharacterized protein YdeI (YjbR/CyaY-like superfamily)
MGTRDPRVDAFIGKAAPFARPILTHIRTVVHEACPDVEETLKWGSPAFMYHGILCMMSAFKEHAIFGFWKGTLIVDPEGRKYDKAMGNFGRLTEVKQLPSKRVLTSYIKQAMRLNAEGVKAPRKTATRRKAPPRAPADLGSALRRNARARATWAGFSASHRREYVEWITEAKRPETRQKRLATTVEWLAEGKARNWKYMARA